MIKLKDLIKEFVPGTLLDARKKPGDYWKGAITDTWYARSPKYGWRNSFDTEEEAKMWAEEGKDLEGYDEETAEHPPEPIEEDYDLDNHPKKEWIKQDLTTIDPSIMEELFRMYKTVYAAEGLGLSAFSASELQSSYEIVMLIDVDEDPMPDAFILLRKGRIKLLATDGGREAKKAIVQKVVNMVKSEGYTLEASKKMNDIMIAKGAPVIMDQLRLEKMVGPKFIKHLEDGYYERDLKKGGTVVKRMYGI